MGDQWWLTIPSALGENKLLTFTQTLNARHTRLAWVNLELLCHIPTDWVISDINIHYRQENEGFMHKKLPLSHKIIYYKILPVDGAALEAGREVLPLRASLTVSCTIWITGRQNAWSEKE